MIQKQVKKLKVENMTLNRDKQALQERVKNLESEKQALQDRLEREKQALQDMVRDLEQKNSQSGRQGSSKSIEGLNRENEIFKDLIKLIDDGKRKEVIQKYYNSGMQDIRDKQYEQAWDNFHRVIALDGNNAEAFAGRAAAYLGMMRYHEAIADFDQALERDENNVFACAYRGITHQKMGQNEKAWADLSQALALAPDSSRDWIRKALDKLS